MINEFHPTALIVDDEPSICVLLSDILSDLGCTCETAKNTSEALERLKQRNFDIALVDIKMPGPSGISLLTTVHESYKSMSVIIVSAVNDANIAVEAIKKGASDYVVKPFRLEEIREKVRAVINGRGNEIS